MKKTPTRIAPARLALEPRIVFDGALAATAVGVDALDKTAAATTEVTPPTRTDAAAPDKSVPLMDGSAASTGKQLIFIDAAARDVTQFLQGMQGEVIALDAGRDGVQQILDALAGRGGVTAIHVLSHGEPGEVHLGSSVLNAATIQGYAPQLASIGEHLSADADLLIYGCRVAEGEVGRQLIDSLAQLTGADVAASVDLTGAADLGGNWSLEAASGAIEARTLAAPEFEGLLAMTNHYPVGGVTAVEDTVFNFTGSNGISVSGSTGGFVVEQVKVTHGVLSLTLSGGAFVIGGANNSSVIGLMGSEADINGTLASLKYTPSADYFGSDTLTLTTQQGSSTVSNVGITITPVADITDDWLATNEGTAITANLITGTNGATADNFENSPTITAVTQGAHGAVTIGVGGNVTYTPSANYNGGDSFTYTVTSGGANEIATVHVTVNPVYDAPSQITPAQVNTDEDVAISFTGGNAITVAGDDVDSVQLSVGHGSLDVTLAGSAFISAGANDSGALTVNGSLTDIHATLATLSYAPTPDFNDADTLTVVTSDTLGATVSSDVGIFVNPVRDVESDSLSTSSNTPVTADLITGSNGATADNFEGTPVITGVSKAAHGSVTIGLGGEVTYTPEADYSGYDNFTVTIRSGGVDEFGDVTVLVDDAPVESLPAAVEDNEDAAFSFTGGNTISVSDVQQDVSAVQLSVGNGVLDLTAAGGAFVDANHASVINVSGSQADINATLASLVYTPAADYNGSDDLAVVAWDAFGETAVGHVAITVHAVNDPPVISAPSSVATNHDVSFSFTGGNSISVGDIEGDLSSVQLTASHGTLDVTLAGGATISAGGNDSATMTISGQQDDINASLASLQFSPEATYAGSASISILAGDGTSETSAGVDVTVAPPPVSMDAPAAITINEDTPIDFMGGNAITLVSATGADIDVTFTVNVGWFNLSGGAVSGSAAAVNAALAGLVFTPFADYDGDGVLTLQAKLKSDAWGDPSTIERSIDIKVQPVADVRDDSLHIDPAGQVSFNVMTGTGGATADTFTDWRAHVVDFTEPPSAAGTLVQDSTSGDFTFTADPAFVGTTTFTYTVWSGFLVEAEVPKPGTGSLETGTVTIVVDADPVATDASVSGNENAASIPITLTGTDASGTITSVTLASLPGNGTLYTDAGLTSLASAGLAYSGSSRTLYFHPDANYTGTTNFSFTVTDSLGKSDATPATATIDVVPFDAAPVAIDASATGNEDAASIPITLTGTDSDGTVASITLKNLPANGTLYSDAALTAAADTATNYSGSSRTFYFVPAVNFHGDAAFDFTVTDNQGLSDATAATATITVMSVNDAPDAIDASATGSEDAASIPITLTGSDIDGTVASVTLGSLPTDGKLYTDAGLTTLAAINTPYTGSSSTLYFVPDANYNGTASFTFTVTDDQGASDATAATATIDVAAVNDAPVATDVLATGNEDAASVTVTLAGTDIDGTVASITLTSLPGNGSLYTDAALTTQAAINTAYAGSSATLYFVPDADYNGSASFNFTVTDDKGAAAATPATASIVIVPVNDGPVATDASASGNEDAASIPVTITGSDIDGTVASVTLKSLPSDGKLYTDAGLTTLAATGTAYAGSSATMYFVPDANYNGTTSFTFTVTDNQGASDATPATASINVAAVNDAPVAADASATGSEDATSIAVTLTGTDIDGTIASVTLGSLPANGKLYTDAGLTTLAATGNAYAGSSATVYFVPDATYNGTTSFTFTVTDDQGASDATPATATITVTPVNDAPVATNAFASGNEDAVSIPITLTGTDIDGTVASIKLGSLPANGKLYTDAGLTSLATINTAYAGASPTLYFVPDANYYGTTSFTFTVTDNQGASDATPATASIDVAAVNDAPLAIDAFASGNEDAASIAVTLTGTDTDGTIASITLGTLPANGKLYIDASLTTLAATGTSYSGSSATMYFVPDANYNGTTSFAFTVTDDQGASDATPASASIDVVAVNDAPTAVDASASGNENAASIPVTLTGTDIDGTISSITLIDLPANGKLYVDPGLTTLATAGTAYAGSSATLYFVPDANYIGPASFNFTVTDDSGASDATPAKVSIDVAAGADVFSNTVPGVIAATEDVPYAFGGSVTVNALDNRALATTLSATHGSFFVQPALNVSGSGTHTLVVTGTAVEINATLAGLSYRADADYNGADTLQMSTSDGTIVDNDAVSISVAPVADIVADSLTTTQGKPVTANLITGTNGASADNFEGSPVITSVTQGAHGSVNFGSDGNATYTPIAGYIGADSFTYTVTSGGVSETAAVTVDVTNTPPVNTVWPDTLTTSEDTPLPLRGVSVADADGDPLITTLTVAHGTLSVGGNAANVSGDGTASLVITGSAAQVNAKLEALIYRPLPDYNGSDMFRIFTNDGTAFNARLASIGVTPVADILADSLTTRHDTAMTANLITGTNGASGDNFEGSPVITAVTQGVHGSVVIGSGGDVTYTPAAGYVGPDSFTYTVTSGGVTESASVSVNVTDTPATNIVWTGSLTTQEDTALPISRVTVSEPDGDPLSTTLSVAHGTLSVGADASNVSGNGTATVVITGTATQINAKLATLVYRPLADYNGADTLAVSTSDGQTVAADSASITVTPIADIVGDALTTKHDTAITANLITGTNGASADNFEGSPVITAVTQGAHGSVVIGSGGDVTYTPAAGFIGSDSFTYTVTSGGVTETAAVTVDVTNTAPSNSGWSGVTRTTEEDTSLAIVGVSVSDADSDVLSTTLKVAHGTLSVDADASNVSGNGTASVVITGTATQINAKLAALIYRPIADYNGLDTLAVATSDGKNVSADSAPINVTPVPDIVADALITKHDTPITANLITGTNGASADNFEGAPVITAVTQGSHGSVTVGSGGNVTYTPAAGYVGADNFAYTVTSGGVTETATVNVDVTNAPAANAVWTGTLTTNEDTTLALGAVRVSEADGEVLRTTLSVLHGTLSVGGNATDASGDGTASLVITGTAAQINARLGALAYRPIADYNGPDTLRISTDDGIGVAADSAAITVLPVADIVADSLTTKRETAITANLITGTNGASADNFEGAPVITAVTQGSHGSVTIGSGGNVTYLPAAGYLGADSFTYTVTSGGVNETATVNISVAGNGGTPDTGPVVGPDPGGSPGGGGGSGGGGGNGGGAGDEWRPPASMDSSNLLAYTPARAIGPTADGVIFETKNLTFVQPVVRHEPLPTESLTYIEPVIRAMQKESELLAASVDRASAPESGSPLFDAFGLAAPKTEFVSPLQRAAQAADHAQAHAQASFREPAGTDGMKDTAPVATHRALDEVSRSQASPRGAPSFSAQLRRESGIVRTAGERSHRSARAQSPSQSH